MQVNPDQLEDYQAHVERLFDQDSDVLVSNSDPKHAAILIATLFRRAKDKVAVFCRNLKADIYSEKNVVEAMLDAARRGIEIRILTQEPPEAVELLWQLNCLAFTSPSKRVHIRMCNKSGIGAALKSNFTVMDDKGFRFEPDKSEMKAHACANNRTLVKSMLQRFDKFFASDATEISLPSLAPAF
jgi:hypothetical protein